MDECSLAEAASDILPIESADPLHSQCEMGIDDPYRDPAIARSFARRSHAAALNIYDLEDVHFDVSRMLLHAKGGLIRDSAYLLAAEEYARARIEADRVIAVAGEETVVLAANLSTHNYFHWMTQALPSIDWARRMGARPSPRLAFLPLAPWQEETLALLGVADLPRLELNLSAQYRFARARYADFLRGASVFEVSRAGIATFRRIAAGLTADAQTTHEIYVARTDSPQRPMSNEADLIALMRDAGVRIVVPGRLSVAEQARLFRGARLVIGPHGAGLTNIGFCQPGALVWELVPRQHPNSCFAMMAQSAGLHYRATVFGDKPRPGSETQFWEVDLHTVARGLAAARALLRWEG